MYTGTDMVNVIGACVCLCLWVENFYIKKIRKINFQTSNLCIINIPASTNNQIKSLCLIQLRKVGTPSQGSHGCLGQENWEELKIGSYSALFFWDSLQEEFGSWWYLCDYFLEGHEIMSSTSVQPPSETGGL
jgi:hypothetical protein